MVPSLECGALAVPPPKLGQTGHVGAGALRSVIIVARFRLEIQQRAAPMASPIKPFDDQGRREAAGTLGHGDKLFKI